MKFRLNVLALAIALTTSVLLLPYGHAQSKSEPITVVSHVDIIPDAYMPQSEEKAASIIRAQTAATKHDPGLISFMVLQQNGARNHLTIIETWRDTQAYEKHQGAPHTVTFRKDIEPYLGGPFDSRAHHQIQ